MALTAIKAIESIDFDKLARLREQTPLPAAQRMGHRHGACVSSRSGDLLLWESDSLNGPLYLEPVDRHVIAISQAQARRRVAWLPTLGLKARAVAAGDVVIVPAGEPMYMHVDEPHRAVLLSVKPSVLYRCLQPAGTAQERLLMLEPSCGSYDPVIRSLADAMVESVRAGCEFGPDFLEATATALSAHLLGRYTSKPQPPLMGRLGRRELALVIEAMKAGVCERPSIDALAALAGYSPYHFTRLFKAATGLPPLQYMLKLRMEHARELIEGTRLSLTEIAAQVGIESPAHFSRSFRAFWQVAPSQLRARR